MKNLIFALSKNALIFGIGSVIGRLLNLLILPIYTQYLSVRDLGALAMLLVFTTVAQPIFSLGLGVSMGPRYFAQDTNHNKSIIVWTVFSFNAVAAIVLSTLGYYYAHELCYFLRLSSDYSFCVFLTALGCAFTVMSTSFAQQIQFDKQASRFVIINLVSALISIILSLVALVFWSRGMIGVVYAQLAGSVLLFLIYFGGAILKNKFLFDFKTGRTLFREGTKVIPGFIFLLILGHVNKYFLEWENGLESVGYYSIGYNIGSAINIVVNGVLAAWHPYFMSFVNRQDEAKFLFGRIFSIYVIFTGSLVVCFFLYSRVVLEIIFPPQYQVAVSTVGYIALGQFFWGIFNLLLPPSYFRNDFFNVSFAQFVACVFSILFGFALIELMGLKGAAISFASTYAFMAGALYFSNRKYVVGGFSIVFDSKKLIKFIACSVPIIFLNELGYYLYLMQFSIYIKLIFATGFLMTLLLLVYKFVLNEFEKDELKIFVSRAWHLN